MKGSDNMEFIDRDGRKRSTEGFTHGFTEHDPKIEENDRTHCHVCGREVSRKWNFCSNCGFAVQKSAN